MNDVLSTCGRDRQPTIPAQLDLHALTI
jgi:hypothetical protein